MIDEFSRGVGIRLATQRWAEANGLWRLHALLPENRYHQNLSHRRRHLLRPHRRMRLEVQK